ncbi:MAG: alpha-amylase family glycosyl hydrolase [Verrucomicrobiota bacterium]
MILLQLVVVQGVRAEGDVVVQLFNWDFARIERAMPEIAEIGFTHVHVSPVQKSLENGRWWGRYQPVDYRVIEGLGTREEFRSLVAEGEKHGVKLVVDVVLNHMSAEFARVRRGKLVEVSFPDFGVEDFRAFRPLRDWDDEEEVREGWMFGALPDLRTDRIEVQRKLGAHLQDLMELGAGGLRVDAARHIAPEELGAIFGEGGVDGLVLGEVSGEEAEILEPYVEAFPEMRLFDFGRLVTFVEGLEGERDFEEVLEAGKADLPMGQSLKFVRNHDIERGQVNENEGLDDERFRVRSDAWQLAHAWLFGSQGGLPYVFVEDPELRKGDLPRETLDRAYLKAGVGFYREVVGKPQAVLRAEGDVLAWARGEERFVVLNRGEGRAVVRLGAEDLKAGWYRDVYSEARVELPAGGELEIQAEGWRGYGFVREVN